MSNPVKFKKSPKEAIFTVLRQISYTKLFKKYSSGDYSFNKISINNLVFNENCLVVARFKDFLIYDDTTEFLRRFYPCKDRVSRLDKILTFYEKYSKIFPNYLVLKENKYLYRNIRKKQKMIDAFNEIKREEKENRKKLKNKEKEKGKNDLNELFTKKVKNEIKVYGNNISFKKYKNSFDSDKNNDDTLLINQNSISLYYKQFKDENENKNKEEINVDSFITNQTNGSISNIVNILNDNKIYTKDLPNIFVEKNYKNNKKNKIIKKGKEKNKNNKKVQRNKEANHNSLKSIINNKENKEENENQSSKHIKNNSQIKAKNKNTLNTLNKYAVTSSNVTNSSSIISKKIKNQQTSSSANKNSKEKNENKNINLENNKDDNNNDIKNIKNIVITKSNNINSNKNIYQNTSPSPNLANLGLKKNFYKTNNNFKKTSLNNNYNNNNKENILKNKNDNKKKEKFQINKDVIKKKYIKTKHISQDFDSNLVCKMADNILNNKINKNNCNSNSKKNIINTENNRCKTYKNFLTNNNPNLITGDTKSNERNEKNFMEVLVNIRDIIKQEKEKEKEKIFFTAKKSKSPEKENILKLTKTRQNIQNSVKTLKFYKTKNNHNYLKTIDNNIKNKKNKDIINEDNKNNKRNASAFTKQKTEYKLFNKKLMTKEQKTKTKPLFIKNKKNNTNNINNTNNTKNKKLLIKSTENFNKTKSIFKNNNNNDNDNDNQIKEKSKNINSNNNINSNKLYEIKYESTLIPSGYENKNNTERNMKTNLSDINLNNNNYDKNYNTSNKKQHKKFKTKNHISKNMNKIFLNNSAKLISDGPEKKYKSFLTKNKNKINNEYNHNSQKNLLSVDILNRIQAVKQNKTKNDFYRTLKVKNSSKNNNSTNSNNKKKIQKTPIVKNKKNIFFKNRISKRLKNGNGNKTKDEAKHNYMSSFSIKVNKTTYNKDKEIICKNKNLKKTWSKNMKNIVNQINNNVQNESKNKNKK